MPTSTERSRELHRLSMARYRARHPDRERARASRWRAANRGKCVEATLRYKAKDPEKVKAAGRETIARKKAKDPKKYLAQACARTRRYREKNPLCHVRRFGITAEQYSVLFVAQNGVCAICLRPERAIQRGKLRALSVDHCHETEKVRGLLCRDCNIALGKLEDSLRYARNVVAYLESNMER